MTGDLIQRRDRAYRGASRMLTGHGRRTQAEWLRELAGRVELNSGGVDPTCAERPVMTTSIRVIAWLSGGTTSTRSAVPPLIPLWPSQSCNEVSLYALR
jgi:hypothetical protein